MIFELLVVRQHASAGGDDAPELARDRLSLPSETIAAGPSLAYVTFGQMSGSRFLHVWNCAARERPSGSLDGHSLLTAL